MPLGCRGCRPGHTLPRHHPGRPGLWCALQGLLCLLGVGVADPWAHSTPSPSWPAWPLVRPPGFAAHLGCRGCRPGHTLPRHHPGRPGLWCALQGLLRILGVGVADLGTLYPVTILAGLGFGAPSRVCCAFWIFAGGPVTKVLDHDLVTDLGGLAFGAASGAAVPLGYRLKGLYPRLCIHSGLTCQLSLSATACRSYLCGSCIIWLA